MAERVTVIFIFLAAFGILPTLARGQAIDDSPPSSCILRTPVNETICGIRGKVPDDRAAKFFDPEIAEVTSLKACAQLCARRNIQGEVIKFRPCVSFYFDTSNNFCQLLSEPLQSVRVDAKHSTQHFYDKSCFDCGPACPQPYNTQLLDNGDFEAGSFGPWYVQNATFATGNDSKRAWKCLGNRYGDCELYQPLNQCKDHLYMIRFDYMPINALKNADLIIFTLATTLFAGIEQKNWTRVHLFSRKASDGLGVDVEFTVPIGRSRYHGYIFDNFQVSRVQDPLPTKAGAPNLISNPGFETGSLGPWKRHSPGPSGKSNVVSPGLNKSKYALSYDEDDDFAALSQSLTLAPGTAYLLKFDYLYSSQQEAGFEISLLSNHQNREIFVDEDFQRNKTSTFSIPVMATGNSTQITFSTQAKVLLDNFSLIELANPLE